MTEIVEQRIKSTVIRRRKKEEPVVETPPDVSAASAVPHVQEVKTVPETKPVHTPPVTSIKFQETKPVPQPSAAEAAKQGVKASVGLHPGIIKATAETIRKAEARRDQLEKEGRLVEGDRKPVIIHTDLKLASTPLTTGTKDLEDKFKKVPKKKPSKAEMLFQDIKRAGGLKHFAQVEMDDGEAPAPVVKERVFSPIPKKKKPIKREFQKTQITETKASKKVLKISEGISVTQMSQQTGVKTAEIIKKLMALGVMATVNQVIDVDTATILAQDFGWEVEHVAFKEENVFQDAGKERTSNVLSRPPVVTVMGHVDHGKTSVLDYIRKTKVAAGEAGGITQHVGAYTVNTQKGKITFIDTPGHAAFTAMRARGAKVTDIVILVVAADDGVMPQTKEAIDHARAAKVPMVVAINKIDKPEANLERAKRSLSEYNVLPEEWGGDTICVGTSARTGAGIDQLLDMVLLQAEMMELKADANAAVKGTVIEAELSRGRGAVAKVLIQSGTIKQGMPIVCGLYHGKVRALRNPLGEEIESAGPSDPVEIIGLSGVPQAGDELFEVSDEKLARLVSEQRSEKLRQSSLAKMSRVSLEDLHKQVAAGDVKELGIVLKTDVHGSAEAIRDALNKLTTEKVQVKVIHSGVGGVNESDVMLAAASNGIIVGFNVVPETGVATIAKQEGVEIRRYSIIYELLDDVRKAMEGLLAPVKVEKIMGRAEVRQVFNISKVGTIAGSHVVNGKIIRTGRARLIRDSVIIADAKLSSLKRFKDDVKEVAEGYECGIGLENWNDIREKDVFENYIIEEIAQKL